jgi:Fe2+ or Zn2+ uptake regulation protein
MDDDPVLLRRLRARGFRVTPQRRAVVEALQGDQVHLSAEEVFAAARHRIPEISLATVYNTLNELAALGELLEVRVAGGATRYDPNVVDGHHHLVCTGCGAIFDVRPSGVTGLGLADEDRRGFELTGVEVTFRGRCPACR